MIRIWKCDVESFEDSLIVEEKEAFKIIKELKEKKIRFKIYNYQEKI